MRSKEAFDGQPNQALAKGLLILDTLAASQTAWGLRELARELGINATTVLRLLTTLQNAGYVERDPETLRYSLGPMVMKLANHYTHHKPLPSIARQVFESYADRFPYNFYLGALSRYEVVYLAVLDGRGPIKIAVEAGGTAPLHTTALGKVLLAFADESYVEAFLEAGGLTPPTPRSITDADQLRAQLRAIRASGVAVNDGEQYEEIGAVGVPVYNHRGRVIAGVSLAFPRYLPAEQRIQGEDLVPLLREISRRITVQAEGMMPQAGMRMG